GDVPSMAASIRQKGLLQPIGVTTTFELIWGEIRLEACKLNGETHILAHVLDIRNIADGQWIENELRKQFTDAERMAIIDFLSPSIEAEAKARRSATLKQNQREDRGGNLPQRKRRARNTLADKAGVSPRKVQQMKSIATAAERDPVKFGDLRRAVEDKTLSVNGAYKELRKRQKDDKTSGSASDSKSNVIEFPSNEEQSEEESGFKARLDEIIDRLCDAVLQLITRYHNFDN